MRSWAIVIDFINLMNQPFSFLDLELHAETTKPENCVTSMNVERYTFSFTLKLTNTLLQKLATFYMSNVKQKHDRMDHYTLYCCHGDDGDYVTTNQQT